MSLAARFRGEISLLSLVLALLLVFSIFLMFMFSFTKLREPDYKPVVVTPLPILIMAGVSGGLLGLIIILDLVLELLDHFKTNRENARMVRRPWLGNVLGLIPSTRHPHHELGLTSSLIALSMISFYFLYASETGPCPNPLSDVIGCSWFLIVYFDGLIILVSILSVVILHIVAERIWKLF